MGAERVYTLEDRGLQHVAVDLDGAMEGAKAWYADKLIASFVDLRNYDSIGYPRRLEPDEPGGLMVFDVRLTLTAATPRDYTTLDMLFPLPDRFRWYIFDESSRTVPRDPPLTPRKFWASLA